MVARRHHEPAFSAPWPALLLSALIVGSYALQSRTPDSQAFTVAYALRPSLVEEGRWSGLVTSMFLHGGWSHAIVNAAFALPFGAAVARLHGKGAGRVTAFFAFYLLCGLIGGLTHVLFNAGDPTPVVGASGAVSGLMGAGARLIGGRDRPGPLTNPFVLALTASYVALNLVMGAFGFAFTTTGAGIAWQAHLGGYFAGLLLIGPWAALFARPRPPADGPIEATRAEGGPWGARSSNEGS